MRAQNGPAAVGRRRLGRFILFLACTSHSRILARSTIQNLSYACTSLTSAADGCSPQASLSRTRARAGTTSTERFPTWTSPPLSINLTFLLALRDPTEEARRLFSGGMSQDRVLGLAFYGDGVPWKFIRGLSLE